MKEEGNNEVQTSRPLLSLNNRSQEDVGAVQNCSLPVRKFRKNVVYTQYPGNESATLHPVDFDVSRSDPPLENPGGRAFCVPHRSWE
jgi:hypothetical protein